MTDLADPDPPDRSSLRVAHLAGPVTLRRRAHCTLRTTRPTAASHHTLITHATVVAAVPVSGQNETRVQTALDPGLRKVRLPLFLRTKQSALKPNWHVEVPGIDGYSIL